MIDTIKVDPLTLNYTHHISLDDGNSKIGLLLVSNDTVNNSAIAATSLDRTSLKTTSGSETYSAFDRPWAVASQDDFSAGIGSRNLEEANNRYLYGQSVNTVHKKIVLSGARIYGSGIRNQHVEMPGNLVWTKLNESFFSTIAKRIVATSAFTTASVDTILRRVGTPDPLTISFHSETDGAPGPSLGSITVTVDEVTDFISVLYRLAVSNVLSLNDVRWIKWSATNANNDNYWMIGASPTHTSAKYWTGSAWLDMTTEPFCLIKPADKSWYPIFFDYKYASYVVVSEEGAAAKVFTEGWRGVATASADKDGLNDTSQSWPVNGLIGYTCYFIEGTGSTQTVAHRKIVSNTATKVVFDTPSAVSFDATTAYVISGGTKWNEVTNTGLTGVVSSLLEYNGIVYFCQGKAINMRRMRWTVGSKYQFEDDGTNKATFITVVREPTATKIWIANNDAPSIQKAAVSTWGTPMSFATALQFDDGKYGRIVNLAEYEDNGVKVLYVFREGMIFMVSEAGVISRFPIESIKQMRRWTNGKAIINSNIYLYFNWGPSIYRWYNKDMKDVGPTVEEGMPPEVQGYCSALHETMGILFAAFSPYDSNGYATIYAFNGVGWAEYYRSKTKGAPIYDFWYQTLPGSIDKMWIFDGNDIIAIPMPSKSLIVFKDPDYTYTYESVFVGSYYAANMYNILKIYNSLSLFASNLSANTWVEADYRLDEETAWTPIKEFFTTGPVQEVDIHPAASKLADTFKGVTGKQFNYRLRLYTSDATITPLIHTVVLEAVSRIPIKYGISATVRIEDNQRDLQGTDTRCSAAEVMKKLREWSTNFVPLRLHSIFPEFDNRIVFLDPPPFTPGTLTNQQYDLTIVVTDL